MLLTTQQSDNNNQDTLLPPLSNRSQDKGLDGDLSDAVVVGDDVVVVVVVVVGFVHVTKGEEVLEEAYESGLFDGYEVSIGVVMIVVVVVVGRVMNCLEARLN